MKGIELCHAFYTQIVRDIVTPLYPAHGACLIGPGSEVLGFDTEMSHDHNWYARCMLFIDGGGHEVAEALISSLKVKLPPSFYGFETKVDVYHARTYFNNALGFDAYAMTEHEWLSAPNQILRELTYGKIFQENETLSVLRQKLSFYPHDILLYILAAQWERIGQEMAFMGRCGDTGDELGSGLLGSRLVTYIMRLCFLYEKQYAPYWKWFGTAFGQLKCADYMLPLLNAVLHANDWKEREKHLCRAYEALGAVHNEANLSPAVEPGTVSYYTRPYLVPKVQEYQESLMNAITNDKIKHLPAGIGAIDQITDQTDFLGQSERRIAIYPPY